MQTWCSPDLFGFEWVDGRQVVAGLHWVGDRVAVGAEHAAFKHRAILARSPHQPYAVKMDRERELKIIRRAYAKQVTASASEIRKSRRPSPRWRGRTSSDPAPGTSCARAAVILRRRMPTRFTGTLDYGSTADHPAPGA
jgi:hypothetical protein